MISHTLSLKKVPPLQAGAFQDIEEVTKKGSMMTPFTKSTISLLNRSTAKWEFNTVIYKIQRDG